MMNATALHVCPGQPTMAEGTDQLRRDLVGQPALHRCPHAEGAVPLAPAWSPCTRRCTA